MTQRSPVRRMRALCRLSLAEARRRPGRVVVTVLTIALGTSALTVALVLADSVERAVEHGQGVEYEQVDIVVRTEIGAAAESSETLLGSKSSGIEQKAIAAIDALPTVQQVATMTRAAAVAQAGDAVRGISVEALATVPAFRWQRFSVGRAPVNGTEIALTQKTLDELRIGFGDRVAVGHSGVGTALFTVVGIVDLRGSTARDTSAYGIVTEKVAEALAGIRGPNTVLISTHSGADLSGVIASVNNVAPVGWPQKTADIVSGAAEVEGARIKSLSVVVSSLAGVSLLVAAITAVTAAAAGLRSRRRTWALARCLGASRLQVGGLVIAESLVWGVVGAVLGVLVGLVSARLSLPLLGMIPGLPAVDAGSFAVRPLAVGLPIALAIAFALVGSLVPMTLAARIRPGAALRQTESAETRRIEVRLILALALMLLGWLVGHEGADVRDATRLVLGSALVILGAGAFLAAVVGLLARLFAHLARRPAARLGLRDIAQRPKTAGNEGVAIALALGMIAFTWVGLSSIQAATSARLSASEFADLTIGAPTGGSVISSDTVRKLARVDGVRRAVPLAFGIDVVVQGADGDHKVTLSTGVVAATAARLAQTLPDSSAVKQIAQFEQGTVYLPKTSFPPFSAGSRVTLEGSDGKVEDLQVAYVDGLDLPAVVSPTTLAKVGKARETRMVWMSLDPEVDRAHVIDEVTGIALLGGQLAVAGPAFSDVRAAQALGAARSAAVAILAVAVLAAAIGAVSTAAVSVAERSREHAVLRALGLPRTSLRQLLVTRILFVGFLAAVVGTAAGAGLGLVFSRAAAVYLGFPPQISLPFLPIVGLGLLTVFVVRAVALVPMERASYIPPARALARG